ncbi:MAG: CapA family protein [Desulfitobacteriaceae bacterium]
MKTKESWAQRTSKPRKAIWKVLIPGILLMLVISGYWALPAVRQAQAGSKGQFQAGGQAPAAEAVTPAQGRSQAQAEALPRVEKITLTAAGDILMHNTQIWSGYQADGTYAFDFFEPVKDLIGEGDYSSTDLEAVLGGPEGGYTGYPLFNSPDAVADTLKNAGFDLVFTANNHILDRGAKGALRTLQVLQGRGLDTTGSFKSQDKPLLIKEIRGVKVGYLAYTYATNGIPLPQNKPYLVNLLEKDKVLMDIKTMRPQVDILILALHWGVEYRPEPTEEQKAMAQEFLQAGADVILGSHPHVIEPMEIIKDRNKNKFVIYSLGNLIGDQHGIERNSGVILNLQFEKDFNKGTTDLCSVSYTPTYSHSYIDRGKQKFRVVAVEDAIAQVRAGEEPYLKAKDLPVLEQVLKQTRGTLGQEGNLTP